MIDATTHAADADHPESVQTPIATLAGTVKCLVYMPKLSILCSNTQGKYASEYVFVDSDTSALIARRQHRSAANCIVQFAIVGRETRAAVICSTIFDGAGKSMEYDGIQVPKMTIKSIKQGTGMHIGKGLSMWSNMFVNGPSTLYGLAVCRAPVASSFFTKTVRI